MRLLCSSASRLTPVTAPVDAVWPVQAGFVPVAVIVKVVVAGVILIAFGGALADVLSVIGSAIDSAT